MSTAHRASFWQSGTLRGGHHSSDHFLSPAQPMVPSLMTCGPCSWPTCGVDQCVSAPVSLLGCPGSQCREFVPAATGDACEPANSCMPFACRLGGVFALIHARSLASVCGLQCSLLAYAPLRGHVRGLTMRKCAPGRV